MTPLPTVTKHIGTKLGRPSVSVGIAENMQCSIGCALLLPCEIINGQVVMSQVFVCVRPLNPKHICGLVTAP